MEQTFKELGVSEEILKALKEMGFEQPTEVQTRTIGPIMNKEDLIVRAKTGSGKTAAFGIPMLQLIDGKSKLPQGLILTPTRELAVQVNDEVKRIAKHLPLRATAVYGQHNMNTEMDELEKGISLLTGTPGRVYDHINQGNFRTNEVKFLVLDEADKMLDMGFIDQVVKIIKALPKDRITLLFSATMPFEIQNISWEYMKNPETIEIESDTKTVDSIHQTYYRVEHHEKRTQMHRLLMVEQPDSCMIFCNTRAMVDRVNEYLERKGYATEALHGAISQAKRLKTINRFKTGAFKILVATDVAARGIHVDDLSLVINYDIPVERDSYVHRIGRTGRAGNGGRALTLATAEDIMSLYEIEEHIGAMIEEGELPTDQEVRASRTAAELKLFGPKKSPREHTAKRVHASPAKEKYKKAEAKPIRKATVKPAVVKPVVVKPVEYKPAEAKVAASKPAKTYEYKAGKPAVNKQTSVTSDKNKAVKAYSKDEVAKVLASYQSKGKVKKKESIFKTIFKRMLKK
ncbi:MULTISPECIES: DEAD/DEAH box helicase [unclassified Fusibacter]|uniref:DEAD/DEAH box helicase n=1 Tax=unclassified Fusibacter TaxID=2624464 RepID=UPI001012BB47|nr:MULTISPECIES: DEAD/DEAH box helicase [unclassified Fusibacter]MCK8058616.1 DEAD/DEAH box helicase [Fusibacter sp. A2]NPE22614.1 DEAD/DEAH box helicase [Fusibacter sp. A1]RXV60179.1 ATP-dependent helicase [Fusibacter sp. A1]